MVDSLLDIAPLSETISVGGKQIEVSGISIKNVANLLVRYPKLLDILLQRKTLDAKELVSLVPEATAAVIAIGVGRPSDKKFEAKAETLAIGDQIALVSAIIKFTLPGGFGPLVEQIEGLTAIAGESVPKASTVSEQLKGNSQDQLNS